MSCFLGHFFLRRDATKAVSVVTRSTVILAPISALEVKDAFRSLEGDRPLVQMGSTLHFFRRSGTLLVLILHMLSGTSFLV